MLEKNKVLLIIVPLTLCTVSCTKAETMKSKAESPQASVPSSVATSPNTTKPEVSLHHTNDLTDIDKLLLQVNRANQANRDLANGLLEQGKNHMEKDRQEGLHGGRSGLSKSFCGSAFNYPTVDALTGCAEAISWEQGNFEAKLNRFKESARLYRSALLFSKRTNASLPAAQRQKIEENITCLDAFVKAPNPETPGCELVRVSLLDPNLPGGKILPSPTGEQ
jgi:hypothetical protein